MSRNTLVGLIVLFFILLGLSIVFQSADPGIRGILADTGFFGALLVAMFLIVTGARALSRRYRQR